MTIEELISKIESNGILTGSRALWGAGPDSDWDYILLMEDYEVLRKGIIQLNIPYSDFSNYEKPGEGLYFDYKDREYNLIGLEPHDFRCWKLTLELMQKLPNSVKIKLDKAGRKEWYWRTYALFKDFI